MPTKTLWFPAA